MAGEITNGLKSGHSHMHMHQSQEGNMGMGFGMGCPPILSHDYPKKFLIIAKEYSLS